MTETDINLTDDEFLLFASVMDIIIPSIDDVPGAGEMGLAKEAEELAARIPEYGESLHRILEALSLEPSVRVEGGFAALDEEQRMSAIEVLEVNMPKYFDKFVDLIYIVYYSDERVHERIGWRSGPLQPLGWELPAWDPAILDKVSKREPFWRKV